MLKTIDFTKKKNNNQQINISGTDFDAQVYITQRHNKWLDRYIVVFDVLILAFTWNWHIPNNNPFQFSFMFEKLVKLSKSIGFCYQNHKDILKKKIGKFSDIIKWKLFATFSCGILDIFRSNLTKKTLLLFWHPIDNTFIENEQKIYMMTEKKTFFYVKLRHKIAVWVFAFHFCTYLRELWELEILDVSLQLVHSKTEILISKNEIKNNWLIGGSVPDL